jgi:hypothetical protein
VSDESDVAVDKIYEELRAQIEKQTEGSLFDDLPPQQCCKIERCNDNPNRVMFLGWINLDRLRSVAGVAAIEEATAPFRRWNEATAEKERQIDARIVDLLPHYTIGEIAKTVGVGPSRVSDVFGRERDKALAHCKKIPDFESYVISREGKVFSYRRNKEVKQFVVNGSTYVQLFKNSGGGVRRRVSQLLAEAWGIERKCAGCGQPMYFKADRVTHCHDCKQKQSNEIYRLAVKLARSHGFDASSKDAPHWKRWAESLGVNFSELVKETQNAQYRREILPSHNRSSPPGDNANGVAGPDRAQQPIVQQGRSARRVCPPDVDAA